MQKFSFLLLILSTNCSSTGPRDCRENVRIGGEGEFPLILLSSIQGSGNTWTRMLIESATGIFTGSKYKERQIYEKNGFLGELEPIDSGKTIACKNHGLEYLEDSAGVILVLRNPYDAFKAEFNRKQTERNVDGLKGRSHVGHADPKAFNSTIWDDTIQQVTVRWKNFYKSYVEKCQKLNIPIHIIYYESLKSDTLSEVKKIINFYETVIGFIPDSVEDRLDCIAQSSLDAFKRKKTELHWEIYHPDQIESINAAIQEVTEVFETHNFPSLPNYFKETPLISPEGSDLL